MLTRYIQSGIGLDLVKDLCAKGWRVACVGRRHEAGKAILKDLPPKKALFFAGDVSNYDEYANIFRKVRQAWGRIDALCQNAAVVDSSSIYILNARQHGIDDIPPAPDMSLVDTNYKGVVYGTQLAIHFMRHNPQPGGRIVVTGSIGSMFPHESYPVYCGTKAAVNHFIRGIAPILKQKENILLNCVMPGIVDTPIVPREMIAAVTPEW